jgi:hypothetical protein
MHEFLNGPLGVALAAILGKVVLVSLSPPVGPGSVPTTWSRSQGIAPGSTKLGSEEAIAMAQTVLVSRECCQVARAMPLSSGLGLWVRGMRLTRTEPAAVNPPRPGLPVGR